MKYELPNNLKLHYFLCEEKQRPMSYGGCKRRCPNTYRECWERHLRQDLALDCAVDNERKAREFVKCSKCGDICDTGLAFDRFLCSKCDNVEYCNADAQKTIMGDEYISIDEQELSTLLEKIK